MLAGLLKVLIDILELFTLIIAPDKGFHHPDPPQIFLNDIVQLIVGQKYPFENRMRFARQ